MVQDERSMGVVEDSQLETAGLTGNQVVGWSRESETRVKSKIDIKMSCNLVYS